MAIQVIIKRTVHPGAEARQIIPLLLQLRSLATLQPGYISGETLSDVENPGECIVISKWEAIEDWNRWLHSPQRKVIQDKIDSITGEETQYNVYAPVIAREPSPPPPRAR